MYRGLTRMDEGSFTAMSLLVVGTKMSVREFSYLRGFTGGEGAVVVWLDNCRGCSILRNMENVN